jgi:hypothetical protein
MHIPTQDVENYVAVLGCAQGSFPQTYLGLPLSNKKLKLNAFAPCWDRPSALAGINHRLLLGSIVGSCWDRPSALAGIDRRL